MLACLCADPYKETDVNEVNVGTDAEIEPNAPLHVEAKLSSELAQKELGDEALESPVEFTATTSDPKTNASDAKTSSFTVSFQKPPGQAGMKFAHVDDLLVVEDVGSDQLAQWNQIQADEVVKVFPFDRVVAVNGEGGSAEQLLARFREEGQVDISFEHPRYYAIELRRGKAKDRQKLGLEVSAHDGGLGIVIQGVLEEGLIPTYNRTVEPEQQIMAYSSIYAINGKEWPSLTLLRMLEKLESFKISMRTWSR